MRCLLKNIDKKSGILPQTRYDWMHLRLQDFKSVSDYNFVLFKICSKLLLSGEKITNDDMLGKSNYTFRGNNHSAFKKTTNDDHRGKTPQNKKLKVVKINAFVVV